MEGAANFTVLDNASINKLNKEELKVYTVNLSKHFAIIREALFGDDGVLGKLSSQLAVSARVNELLLRKLEAVERTASSNAQYARKEPFEVHGIPEDIPDTKIEETVISIINELKVASTPDYEACESQACHRLQNRKKVICKMTSRKRMRNIIKSRKKLKDYDLECLPVKVYITESLAPAYSTIDYYARNLKKKKHIHACWFFNGTYIVVLEEGGEKKRISHILYLEHATGLSEDEMKDLCPPSRFARNK